MENVILIKRKEKQVTTKDKRSFKLVVYSTMSNNVYHEVKDYDNVLTNANFTEKGYLALDKQTSRFVKAKSKIFQTNEGETIEIPCVKITSAGILTNQEETVKAYFESIEVEVQL